MANTAQIAVAQTTSATFVEGAIAVDYPSGIAVDELMVLFLFCSDADTISTPSGWTVVSNTTTVFQGLVNTDVYVYKKVVDSGDVSAGSISVDVDDAGGQLAYVCFRITGYNTTTSTEQVSSGDDTSSSTTRTHTVSITPTTSGSLLLAAYGWDGNAGTTSTYTATGSPTFTEVGDFARSTTDIVSVAYAQINNTDAITSLGFTSSAVTTRSQAIGFIVRTAVNSNDEHTLVTGTSTPFAQTGMADAQSPNTLATGTGETFSQTGVGIHSAIWTNPDKPTTTWVNPDK